MKILGLKHRLLLIFCAFYNNPSPRRTILSLFAPDFRVRFSLGHFLFSVPVLIYIRVAIAMSDPGG